MNVRVVGEPEPTWSTAGRGNATAEIRPSLRAQLRSRAARLATRANWNAFVELVRAHFKVTDHNSILGVLWSLLGPVATLVALYFIFRQAFGDDAHAYPLYLLIGIVLVGFFITATRYMLTSFLYARSLVLNSTVPRETIILSQIVVHGYKLVIEIFLCCLLSAVYGLFSWRALVLAVPLGLAYLGLVLGVGLLLALVHCFARDIDHIWAIVSRLLFFVTPVFYFLDRLSPAARELVYWANPLTPFLLSFRSLFMEWGRLEPFLYLHSLALGAAFLTIGYSAFLFLESAAVERA
jgi:ABC-2 type transport system permease protein